jgi:hypothetical protein
MNFPSSPTLNQTYTYANKTWRWNGTAWNIVPLVQAPAIFTSATAPNYPVSGTKWINTTNGVEYTYYVDADSSQWIELSHPSDNLFIQLGNLDGGTPTTNYGGTQAINGGTP